MIVESLVSPFLDANCYVCAPAAGAPALVVDPGVGIADRLGDVLARWDLSVGAVLATHGHLDHVWDAAAVAGDAPVYVPQPDLYRMENPAAPEIVGEMLVPLLEQLPTPWVKPANVQPVPQEALSATVDLVEGVGVRMLPAPGHSEGSSLFFTAGPIRDGNQTVAGEDARLLCFDGDVIFAGSVGRSDLPGSDSRLMLQTLRTLLNVVDPETVLLPGHGPATTMKKESATNPYLNQARHVG